MRSIGIPILFLKTFKSFRYTLLVIFTFLFRSRRTQVTITEENMMSDLLCWADKILNECEGHTFV
jgi:hypothetical protein